MTRDGSLNEAYKGALEREGLHSDGVAHGYEAGYEAIRSEQYATKVEIVTAQNANRPWRRSLSKCPSCGLSLDAFASRREMKDHAESCAAARTLAP